MNPVPSMRSDCPRCAGNPSPARQELLDDIAALKAMIDGLSDAVVTGLNSVVKHTGGIDRALTKALVKEAMEDMAFHELNWLENRLEETP